jgi:hypothetical protein
MLAGLSLKTWRPAVLNLRAAAPLVITLLILAPNLLWIKNHSDLAFASAGKFDIDPTHSFKSMVHGIGSWASTCLDQVGLLLVVFVLLCWRGLIWGGILSRLQDMRHLEAVEGPLPPHPNPLPLAALSRRRSGQGEGTTPATPRQTRRSDLVETRTTALPLLQGEGRGEGEASAVGPIVPLVALRSNSAGLLLRTFVFSAAIIVLGIIISGATNCRNRWLQPLVIPAPILVAALCQEQLKERRLKLIVGLAAAVAVGVAAPGRILLTERLGKLEGLNAPFRGLAGQIKKPLQHASQIYCADTAMAGNLRVWFPDKAITAPGTSKLYPPQPGCALVWDPSVSRSSPFVSGTAALTGNSPGRAVYFEERLKYHHINTMRLGVLTARGE